MKNLSICLLAMLLIGCAATPYQPVRSGCGYADLKVQDGVYKVYFSGNSNTREDVVENYTLLRAADLTLEKGYTYFSS